MLSRIHSGLDSLRLGLAPQVANFLQNRRIGLVTNHTGRAEDGRAALGVLGALGVDVCAIFSPEHGYAGILEGAVASGRHQDLPLHSLYGETRRPTPKMLQGLDVLVVDLQDVGARFYTYSTTLAYCMEECARHGVAVLVLDRPNPLGGCVIEGPLRDEANRSFIGHLNIPIRHAMTMGELALLHQADLNLNVELKICPLTDWRREMHWAETGLDWPVPSPNLPDWESAHWYPGPCLLEFSGVSVGRGTEAPFQIIGAPWMNPEKLLVATSAWPAALQDTYRLEALDFTPERGEHANQACRGLRLRTTLPSSSELQTVPLGLGLLAALHHTHAEFDDEKLRACRTLLGSNQVLEAIAKNEVAEAMDIAERDAESFRKRRENFLLYQ